MVARLSVLALAPTGPHYFSGFHITPAAQCLARHARDSKQPHGARWLPVFFSFNGGNNLHLQIWPRHRDYPGETIYFDDLAIHVLILRHGIRVEHCRIDVDPQDASQFLFFG